MDTTEALQRLRHVLRRLLFVSILLKTEDSASSFEEDLL
jgi:hypothetical protein